MRGSGCATAASAESSASRGSYTTLMRSSAAVAVSSVVAATAATGSPMKRTLSTQRVCSSCETGRIPNGIGRSGPVSTACTPSSCFARVTSIETMRACGWVLRGAQVGDRLLQGLQLAALRHRFDGSHGVAGARETQRQARQDRRSIQQHGARAALTQLAAVLRSGESQILAQYLEQRLMRRERYFLALTIHLEGDRDHDVILIRGTGDASFLP